MLRVRLMSLLAATLVLNAPSVEAAPAQQDPAPTPLVESETPTPADSDGTPADATTPSDQPASEPATEGDPSQAELDAELDRLIEQASQDSDLGGWNERGLEREPTYPRFEHHGYFRFRTDIFWNGHLGHSAARYGDSPNAQYPSRIPAPLTENNVNNSANTLFPDGTSKNNKTLASANIRFRYQPTFHISPSMKISATFDVLDNLVLGSTPDFAGNLVRNDVPLVAFTGGQASPVAGVNAFRDAIQVKEAWAEWRPAFLLRAGRMQSNWGLGILANGGSDIDDDYGDYADRVLLGLKIFDVYLFAGYDFVYSGFTTDAYENFFGQAMDLGTADDVQQVVVSLFQKPLSAEDKAERQMALRERFEPVFDWGIYAVYRQQEFDYASGEYQNWYDLGDGGYTGVTTGSNYDALELEPRNAWAVVPDLWLRYQQRFNYFSGIRIELEAVGVFGGMDVINSNQEAVGREIQQVGGALEIEVDYKSFSFGLDTGFATGDGAEGYGADILTLEQNGVTNTRLTAFKFDRNYDIDLIMFREVVGTITNAMYIRPWLRYDLFDSVEDALGVRLDMVYGRALIPSATAGDAADLGFEIDLRLFYEERDRFNFDLESGLMIPFEAFSFQGNKPEEVAFTFQGRMTLQF